MPSVSRLSEMGILQPAKSSCAVAALRFFHWGLWRGQGPIRGSMQLATYMHYSRRNWETMGAALSIGVPRPSGLPAAPPLKVCFGRKVT